MTCCDFSNIILCSFNILYYLFKNGFSIDHNIIFFFVTFARKYYVCFILYSLSSNVRSPTKLLKYFNGTSILTLFVLPSSCFFLLFIPWILMIQILLKYHLAHLYKISINFSMFLNNYCFIQLNYKLAIQHQRSFALSIRVLFIWFMQSVKGAQFLDKTSLFLRSIWLAAWSATLLAIRVASLKIICKIIIIAQTWL